MKGRIVDDLKLASYILSKGININETQLNLVLYNLICYNDYYTISKRFEKYYCIRKTDDIYKQQSIVKQKTLNFIESFDIGPLNKDIELKFSDEDYVVMALVKSRNLRVARIHLFNSNLIGNFNFDVYRELYSVSCLEDMSSINCKDTKFILLKVLFLIYVKEIFEEILNILKDFGIIDDYSFYKIRDIKDIHYLIPRITAICLSDNNIKTKVIDNADKTKMLKEYCRFIQGRNAVEGLINILENLKDRFEIYPQTCKKKKFAEIVYILYRCQYYIGMRTKAIKTYKKFMTLMRLYYDYPETTYKINDIKNDAMDLMNYDLYLKDFKVD